MKTRAYLAILALLPGLALAHPGHDLTLGFMTGVQHPWAGLDHLAAMLAIGLWAAQLGGVQRWAVPVSFVSVMLLGAALGYSGVVLSAVEPGIAASVLVLGLLVAMAVRLPAMLCVLLASGFALLHGHAHGAEMPLQASALSYIAGFALSTAVLHGLGLLLACLLTDRAPRHSLRWVGALVATSGAALLMA